MPLLLIPRSAASWPRLTASSPSIDARSAARTATAARVRSPRRRRPSAAASSVDIIRTIVLLAGEEVPPAVQLFYWHEMPCSVLSRWGWSAVVCIAHVLTFSRLDEGVLVAGLVVARPTAATGHSSAPSVRSEFAGAAGKRPTEQNRPFD